MFAIYGSSPNNFNVTLNVLTDQYNSTISSVTFNCSSTDETGVLNLTLVIDSVDNETLVGGVGQNLSLETTKSMADGSYNWTCRASDGTGVSDPVIAYSRNLTIDTTTPTIATVYNLTTLVATSFPISSNWNYSSSDAHLSQCYYNSSANTTWTFVTCNTPIINTNWTTAGNRSI